MEELLLYHPSSKEESILTKAGSLATIAPKGEKNSPNVKSAGKPVKKF